MIKTKPVIHYCTQEEAIKRINTILVGNGHPEDGLAFVVRASLNDIKDIKVDISDIKKDIRDAIDASTKATKALDLYKAEIEGYDKREEEELGKQEIAAKLERETKRDNWYKVLTIIAIAVTLLIGIANLFKSGKIETISTKTETKVDNFGVPVTTRNGEIVNIPGVDIKVFPKDFIGDTTKVNK
jgi:hypothetical protein